MSSMSGLLRCQKWHVGFDGIRTLNTLIRLDNKLVDLLVNLDISIQVLGLLSGLIYVTCCFPKFVCTEFKDI